MAEINEGGYVSWDKVEVNEGGLIIYDVNNDEGRFRLHIYSDPYCFVKYWGNDGKPYLREQGELREEIAKKARLNKFSGEPDIHVVYAMIVMNLDTKKANIWEVEKKSILKGLKEISDKFDLMDVDIIASKSGEGKESRYAVTYTEKRKLTEEELALIKEADINLEEVYNPDVYNNFGDKALDVKKK